MVSWKHLEPRKASTFCEECLTLYFFGCFFAACQRFLAVRTSTQPKITHIEGIKFPYFHANVFVLRELALHNALLRLVSYKSAPTPKHYFYLTARQSLMCLIYWLMLRQTRMYWQMVLAFCWPRPWRESNDSSATRRQRSWNHSSRLKLVFWGRKNVIKSTGLTTVFFISAK